MKSTAIHVIIAVAERLVHGASVVGIMANVVLQCQDMKMVYLYAQNIVPFFAILLLIHIHVTVCLSVCKPHGGSHVFLNFNCS